MVIVIYDEALLQTLYTLTEKTELYSPNGQFLGYFFPTMKPKLTNPEMEMKTEDLKVRENDPDAVWYTSAKVVESPDQLRKNP